MLGLACLCPVTTHSISVDLNPYPLHFSLQWEPAKRMCRKTPGGFEFRDRVRVKSPQDCRHRTIQRMLRSSLLPPRSRGGRHVAAIFLHARGSAAFFLLLRRTRSHRRAGTSVCSVSSIKPPLAGELSHCCNSHDHTSCWMDLANLKTLIT